ncbi:hypothetical protein DFH08DRAFT_821946 [Mycena albidolilacea]|uniref:Uncharacterized protein n=1 Tax=Mycena albidolilacea TaxID=1033008 RepID=A0AAD7ECR0_9AGAR|nr:hypothetical protein DFH08DRAFT_821946 [Mycena albidolilacea]
MIQIVIATTEDCPTEAISKSTTAMDTRPCIFLGISLLVIVAIGIEFRPLSLAESLSPRCWHVLSLLMGLDRSMQLADVVLAFTAWGESEEKSECVEECQTLRSSEDSAASMPRVIASRISMPSIVLVLPPDHIRAVFWRKEKTEIGGDEVADKGSGRLEGGNSLIASY